MKKPASPKPVVVTTICSICGLGWEAHGDDPTTEDCIRLLKDQLAMARQPINITYPITYPIYPRHIPWWSNGVTYQSSQSTIDSGHSLNYNTPRVIESTCTAVAA